MYRNHIVLGSLLIVSTVVIHAVCTGAVLRFLKLSSRRGWNEGSYVVRSLVVAAIVLLLCYASLLEAAVWAGAYVLVGAISSFEPAMYFSIVTFTTLGYGDLVLSHPWRILAATQAANGIIIFGWTTAIVVTVLQRVGRHEGEG